MLTILKRLKETVEEENICGTYTKTETVKMYICFVNCETIQQTVANAEETIQISVFLKIK